MWKLLILCFISFISVWLKVSGLIIPLSLALIAFKYNRKVSLSLLLSGFLGFLTYGLYAVSFNSKLFWQMLVTQSARNFSGPASLISSILHPSISVPFYDGWIIFGYLSLFSLLFLIRRKPNLNFLTMPLLAYILFFCLFGGFNFPWYQFIIYPILAMAAGTVLSYFLHNPRVEFNLFFFLIVVSTYLHYNKLQTNWINFLNNYRILIFLFIILGLVAVFLKYKSKLFLRISLLTMCFYALYLGLGIINNLNYLWPILMENSLNIY